MIHSQDILSLHNVCKEYLQGGRVIQVLNNVDATFLHGQSYAITGVSGSGKSTLLHLLGGLDSPTSGSVNFNKTDLAHMRPAHKNSFLNKSVGFVFQFHYLVKELSVRENIMFSGMIRGESKKQCMHRSDHLLEVIGMPHKADAYPTQLSGGEQQRVAIARALFNKPAFLLADEPTGNLDEENAQAIVELFFEAQQEWGMGMVICSHDGAVYKRMGTIYKMHHGQLVA